MSENMKEERDEMKKNLDVWEDCVIPVLDEIERRMEVK